MRKNKKGKRVLNFNDFADYLIDNVQSIGSKKEAIKILKVMIDFFHEGLAQDFIIEIKKLFVLEKRYFKGKSGIINFISNKRTFTKGKGVKINKIFEKKPCFGKPHYKIKFKESVTISKLINSTDSEQDNKIKKKSYEY